MRVYVAQEGGMPNVNVCQLFKANWPHIEWEPADKIWDVKVILGDEGQSSTSILKIKETDCDASSFKKIVTVEMTEGNFFIPIEIGEGKIKEVMDNNRRGLCEIASLVKKEKDLNVTITGNKLPLAAFEVEFEFLQKQHPRLASLLRSRYQTRLQRRLPSWKPMKWQTTNDSINKLYPILIQSGKELKELVSKYSADFSNLGINMGSNELDHVQLDLGLPFPGFAQREGMGLKDPDQDLIYWMEETAKKRLAGIVCAYDKIGESFVHKGVHTSVRVANYQGAITSSTSHLVRQALWGQALKNPKGLMMYAEQPMVTVSGLRNSANFSGKKRASYVLDGDFCVLKTNVKDAEELKGKIFPITAFGSKKVEYFTDYGAQGARVRIVANVQSEINDIFAPIAGYMASYKYKGLEETYSQSEEVMDSFVTNSFGWRARIEEMLLALRRNDCLHKSFVDKSDVDIINELIDKGEKIVCGDVVNYDSSATSIFLQPYFKKFLNKDMFTLFIKTLRCDKVGVYANHDGLPVYYYINCGEFSNSYLPSQKDLIARTSEYFDSLPSGCLLTSEAGKAGMSSTSMVIGERALLKMGVEDPRSLIEKLDWEMVEDVDFKTPALTFMKNFTNNGGDDHHHATSILTLITGKSPEECESVLIKEIENFKCLSIGIEEEKMNCGHMYHSDENGTIIARTLSPKRFVTNMLYPEYPRGAVGFWHSYSAYVNSAIGTAIEDDMLKLGELMVTKILGFDSIEQLEYIAELEEEHLQEHPEESSPLVVIAAQLGIKQNDLIWTYTHDQLLELGVDEELLDQFKRSLPSQFTNNIFRFFNEETVSEILNQIRKG